MSDLISYGFLVPPAGLIVLSTLAAWLALWHPRLGISVGIIATSLLYLASLPVVAARMLDDVEVKMSAKPDFTGAQAIVVLGGGVHRGDGGKVPDTLGEASLARVYLAAQAYRQLKLKIAVTGGRAGGAHVTEASLMKAVLENDFGLPVSWVEDRSRTTYENALFTAKLLRADNVSTVVLVTDAWHMRRAQWSFEHVGLHAIPWQAPLDYTETARLDDFLPDIGALGQSYHALHEALGLVYYRWRY
jgi:uncharacterized SAM-binding protein YcdF (DUF218 family)